MLPSPWGLSYREFRKGLTDLQSQINLKDVMNTPSSYQSSSKSPSYTESKYGDFDDHDEATAPRFEPPPVEPQGTCETPAATETPPSDAISKSISEK